ncbi:MAG: hypothetical protein JSU92_12305 [Deltaproteobacteria bacterium]|nr:MAG: hypothetical protein JSU92_12305 [Deltaproteobacteria bacterium]
MMIIGALKNKPKFSIRWYGNEKFFFKLSPPLTGGDKGEGERVFEHLHLNPPPSRGRTFITTYS